MELWLKITIGVLIFLLISFGIYLFLICPGKNKKEIQKFISYKYAHRGLHKEGVPENSLEAFKRAAEGGFGIELDVRLSSDGVLMVFHDDTLERMTEEEGRVDKRCASELREIKLLGTDEHIPTFDEVLELVSGKVPLLVEIKEDSSDTSVSAKVAQRLKSYEGDFIIESFNPLSLEAVKKKMPNVVVGILSQNYLKSPKYRKPVHFLLHHFLLNCICRPNFIAFSHEDIKIPSYKVLTAFFRRPMFAWTIKSAQEEKRAIENGFDTVIFEGYIPEKSTCKD